MRIVRTAGLLTLGIVVGAGIFGSRNAAAQQGQSARIAISDVHWSSGQGFRFFRDNLTRECFIASVSNKADITAMVRTQDAACGAIK